MPFENPDGVMFVKVDPTTALTDQDEQHGTVELFTKGTEPTKSAGSKIDPTDFYKLDQLQDSVPPPRSSRNASPHTSIPLAHVSMPVRYVHPRVSW